MTPHQQFEAKARETLFDLFMEIQIKEYKSQPLAGEYTDDAMVALLAAYDAGVGEVIGEDENYSWHKSGATNTYEGLQHHDRITRNTFRAEQRRAAGLEGK